MPAMSSLPLVVGGREALVEEAQHEGEGRGLGPHGDVGRDGQRRALVDVGHPHVEGHRRQLEAEARPPPARAPPAAARRRSPAAVDGHRHLGEVRRAQRAVEQHDAVEQQAGGEGPQEHVLHGGLVGAAVVQRVPAEDVQAEAQQLQRQVGGQQLAGRGHHHHRQHGDDNDGVVLARVCQVLVHVVQRAHDDGNADAHREHLEEEGVAVDPIQAAEEAVVLVQQEGHGEGDDGGEAGHGDPGQDVLAGRADNEVQRKHQEGQSRDKELGPKQLEANVHRHAMPIPSSSGFTPLSMISTMRKG